MKKITIIDTIKIRTNIFLHRLDKLSNDSVDAFKKSILTSKYVLVTYDVKFIKS